MLTDADLVVSQAIANPTTTFNVQDVRDSTNAEVVFVPYVYVDGISSLEIIASKGKLVIRVLISCWLAKRAANRSISLMIIATAKLTWNARNACWGPLNGSRKKKMRIATSSSLIT